MPFLLLKTNSQHYPISSNAALGSVKLRIRWRLGSQNNSTIFYFNGNLQTNSISPNTNRKPDTLNLRDLLQVVKHVHAHFYVMLLNQCINEGFLFKWITHTRTVHLNELLPKKTAKIAYTFPSI